MEGIGSILAPLLRRRRRLAVIAVAVLFIGSAAFGVYWWTKYRAAAEAETQYHRTWLSYQVGLATETDVCAASRAACLAGLRVPLSDPVRTYVVHLARVQHMDTLARDFWYRGEWGQGGKEGRDLAIRQLETTISCTREARDWLKSVLPQL